MVCPRTFAIAALAAIAATGCVNLDERKGTIPFTDRHKLGMEQKASKAAAVVKSPEAMARATNRNKKSFSDRLIGMMPRWQSRSAENVINSGSKDDPTSLQYEAGKLGADLYIASARLSEKSGRYDFALEQYQSALNAEPQNRHALIGMARLRHRMGDMPKSIEIYLQALKVYRDDPVILNDLGLCYARHGRLDDAIEALGRATQVAPSREMYRNNLAAALVEAGRAGAAVETLSSVGGPAQGNYNVGYLLARSGRQARAMPFLQRSLELDPNLQQARTLLAQIGPGVGAAQPAHQARNDAIQRIGH